MKTIAVSLVAAAWLGAQQLPPARLLAKWPPLWSNINTRPKDCHLGVVDALGRLVMTGVETLGDPRTVGARQAMTLLVHERGYWSDPIQISKPGIVFFPSFAIEANGRVWIAWSEFRDGMWRIMVRNWNRGALSEMSEVSSQNGVNLQPSLAVLPSGEVYVTWQTGVKGRFEIRGRSWKDGAWSAVETLSRGGGQEFRPQVLADSNGGLWVAWDRATGSRYEVFTKLRGAQGWGREVNVFASPEITRAVQMARDSSGRMWFLASGKLAGVDAPGHRYRLGTELPQWKGGADFFTIDGRGRFWFFKALVDRQSFDWLASWKNAVTAMAVADAGGLHMLPSAEVALGYGPPQVDAEGNLWIMNTNQFLRFAKPFAEVSGSPVVNAVPFSADAGSTQHARLWPRRKFEVSGKTLNVYWAEMHNHLQELPTDRVIAAWVDRLYLTTRYRDGLDVVAITDHDWPGMTRSMYYVEQGIASILNDPGRFLAFTGFEWSGDSQVRSRFGDRTVLFPDGYHDIPRISDGSSDTALKLSGGLKRIGALAWPHHIGWAGDPKDYIPETDAVMEMTSNHGVFETYNLQDAVPVPFRRQPNAGSSVQDTLALGKRMGLVGSSDSHSGFSGFSVGMLAIVAPELTRESVLNAIRQRRVYAVRGGEPILIDFRVNGRFMGDEFTTAELPKIEAAVKGSKPVTRIDIVRNNRYVLCQQYSDGGTEKSLSYMDRTGPPAFYYVRVWQGPGQWAWTSPVWVNAR